MATKEYQKLWKRQNKEHVVEYHKKYQQVWYRNNVQRYILYSARARAKKKGIPFDLTLDDIVVPEVCPILRIPLFRNVGQNGACPNSPSLDRIDPVKGYVKGNVWVISQRANVMKNDATQEELERFADWVKTSQLS